MEQMIQATRNVDEIDSEYLDKLAELVLFYWEYKEDNPTIIMAEAWLTLVTYCYNLVVGIGVKSPYIIVDDEREIK